MWSQAAEIALPRPPSLQSTSESWPDSGFTRLRGRKAQRQTPVMASPCRQHTDYATCVSEWFLGFISANSLAVELQGSHFPL